MPGGDRHNGRQAVVDALRNDPTMMESIHKAVMASVSADITDEVAPEDISDDGKPKFRRGSSDV